MFRSFTIPSTLSNFTLFSDPGSYGETHSMTFKILPATATASQKALAFVQKNCASSEKAEKNYNEINKAMETYLHFWTNVCEGERTSDDCQEDGEQL
jgi:hypothetical protein